MTTKRKEWWRNKWGEDKCSITYTRLRPGVAKNGIPYTATLKCGHRFCTNALLEWVKKSNHSYTCPMCRQKFHLIDIICKN